MFDPGLCSADAAQGLTPGVAGYDGFPEAAQARIETGPYLLTGRVVAVADCRAADPPIEFAEECRFTWAGGVPQVAFGADCPVLRQN
jgi:hypothetical protein